VSVCEYLHLYVCRVFAIARQNMITNARNPICHIHSTCVIL